MKVCAISNFANGFGAAFPRKPMADPVTTRRTCRLCASDALVRCVALAAVPIVSPNVGAVDDGKAARLTAPLDIYLCRSCGLSQLVHVVDPALIYRNYLYHTAVSVGLTEHFRELSDTVISRLSLVPADSVVEFGSNDGTLLRFFQDAGMAVTGIDPAESIAAEATRQGIPTRAEFFGARLAEELRRANGPAKAIIANNAMANIDNLDDIFRGVEILLAPDGVLVFETQYALDVFEKTLLDVIYHEHISNFSVQPLARCLKAYGLRLFDAQRISTKGGSVRIWVQRDQAKRQVEPAVAALIDLEIRTGLYEVAYYRRFSERVAEIKAELHRLIAAAKETGRPIAAFGTSVGCAALIHQFDLARSIDFLVDDMPFKGHLEGPDYDLPVLSGEAIAARNPALVVILAWRYAELIAAKHRSYLAAGGRFVVPLPAVSIMSDAR
jgi:SAM-dependent methyltransferase